MNVVPQYKVIGPYNYDRILHNKKNMLRENKVPFSMAIGNGELMHECFPKPSRMGTARTE